MNLTSDIFALDAEAVSARIETFLRDHTSRMGRRGVAVGISGGVDSSLVALLCVRALGAENVHGLILREKQGNPDARRYARLLADHLHISTTTIDVSPVLKKLGVYRFITGLVPSRKLAGTLVKKFMASYAGNPYLDHKRGTDRPIINRGFAMINAKHRVRLVYAYRYVEQRNLALVGCAHASEKLLGLYVKFGIDDCADLMPLGNLYRSHVLILARYLGVPQQIVARTPSPDVVPGIEDKYRDVFGVDSGTMDLVLLGLEREMPADEIARHTGLQVSQIEDIARLIEQTYHMREPGIVPSIPPKELYAT